jgi:hypothetical protein
VITSLWTVNEDPEISPVSEEDAQAVLNAVAAWLGSEKGMTADGRPTPTGRAAADSGLGPQLVMDWDWPSTPTPTILLEGGPYDWALEVWADIRDQFPDLHLEPYAGYALCIYEA